MIATIINAILIVIGTMIGLLMRKGFSERARDTVFTATGVISLVIGFSMALGGSHILALALSLIIGGLVGTAMDIEGAIFRFGEWLRVRFTPKAKPGMEAAGSVDAATGDAYAEGGSGDVSPDGAKAQSEGSPTKGESGFAFGFLNASVLFCVGAMALVGSFKAGAEGDYDLILTKSVMDGVVAIMFAGAMGIGVGFSAISVLVYQGALTLLAVQIKPFVSATMLTELSAVGGALIVMIGINLLGLRKVRTGDFLPSLAVIIGLVFLFDYIPFL
ncbi:MAG: DUF554 domain-containing protein [Spirochaetota bacterium]